MASLEVFENRPFDFCLELEVAACHVEAAEKLLLLKRGPNESEGGTWGVPAGKIEGNETPDEAAVRELFEETGIAIGVMDLQAFGKLYIRKPHVAYVCHLFRISMRKAPLINLSDEHTDYKWVSLAEAQEMSLISGANEMLRLYDRFVSTKGLRS
jgi:8-oxo-dGTP pyrophosphatase MutT (NUDIX family)